MQLQLRILHDPIPGVRQHQIQRRDLERVRVEIRRVVAVIFISFHIDIDIDININIDINIGIGIAGVRENGGGACRGTCGVRRLRQRRERRVEGECMRVGVAHRGVEGPRGGRGRRREGRVLLVLLWVRGAACGGGDVYAGEIVVVRPCGVRADRRGGWR